MARAGFCSACGTNVWLTPEAGCPNGHGPEFISGVYDTEPDVPAPEPAVEPPPVVADAPSPVAMPVPSHTPPTADYSTPPQVAPAQTYIDEFGRTVDQNGNAVAEPPARKRTGLIIVIVIAALILLCACPVVFVIALGSAADTDTNATPATLEYETTSTTTTSPDQAEEPVGTLLTTPETQSESLSPTPTEQKPAMVTVPDVEGMTAPDDVLTKAGLVPKGIAVHGPVESDAKGFMEAYRQDPKAGTQVPTGSTVSYRFWWESQ